MLSIIKGNEYEKFIKNHIINELNKEAYLWKEIPEKILLEANLIHSHNHNRLKRKENLNNNNPLTDVGVDILQIDDDNNYTFVQCKNGYNKGIRIEDLAGFYMLMANHSNMDGNVYYTSKLSIHIRENAINNKIKYIKKVMEIKEEIQTDFSPYDYQIEASNKIIDYLKENNNAILSMPCGCGKTFTSYLISKQYDKIIIISPLKQFAKQNMDRYIEYGSKNNLLLDSDGTRDLNEVQEFINNNKEHLISCTYKSVDILQQLNLNNYLIIVDEFHNLSKNNVYNENDDFYKLLNSENKFMFMSATPRIYELEDDDNLYDLGEIVYNMSFTEAIEKKFICDYRIYLPSIHEDNSLLIYEIGINDIDNELKAKCMFLYKCILFHGSRKCIIYCQDLENLNNIKDCLIKLNDFYLIDLNIQEITSETSYKNREKILNIFESSNKIELLLSIRILDECIDIPSCDSIYISYPSKCKIRTIQRLCRCIRLDKKNKFKIGNIFIWCNDYDLILDTLSGIKEYDVLFKNKISILETNFMNKKEIDEKVLEDKKLIEKYILDIKEFKQYTWYEKLEQVKKYIDENKKLPSQHDKDKEIKQLGTWISNQKQNYKNKKEIMNKELIYNAWTNFLTEYKEYLLNNEEIWYKKLDLVKKYIDENKKRPSKHDKKKNIKELGYWIGTQKKNYNIKECIMNNEKIYNKYTEFITEYQEYFLSIEEVWYNNLNKVQNYINENNKLPSQHNKNQEIKKLGNWISENKQNYKKKQKIMRIEDIYNNWGTFINNNNELFLSNEELWYNNLEQIIQYINKNKKLPLRTNKDKNIIKLCRWIDSNKQNYKNNLNCMKDKNIKKDFELFIEKYQEYF